MKRFLYLLALCSLALPLCASNLITHIKVVDLGGTSNQEALEQVVYSAIGTRVGDEFSPAQLSKDIQTLVKTRGIDDVQTKVNSLADDTIEVTFLVTLRQRIAEIRFEGGEAYSERKLKGRIKTKVGEMLDEQKQAADRKSLFEKYDKDGYHGTVVSQRIEPAEGKANQVVLTYVIQEATRAKLKGVAFEGNTVFEDSELSSVIMTKREWWRYIFRFGNYYNSAMRGYDIDRIVKLYATKGYLDAQVTNVEEVYLDESRKWVRPTYFIEEGQPYTLGTRTFQGNTKFSTDELMAKTTLLSGEIYNADIAEADLDNMKALYENLGYLDLRFYPDLQKDTENHIVNVVYSISEGEPSRIGEINIVGNTTTADHVIRRELAIFEDDLADNRKIKQTKNRLENLDYFESVDIVAKTTENPARRDLSIELKEKPTGSISVGAAFSTEDSVVGFVELSEKNFSLDKFLHLETPKGDGQHMRLALSAGSETMNFSLSLTEPALFDSQFSLTNEFFVNTRYEDEYDERHIGYQVSVGWPIAFQLPFFPNHTEYWRISTGLRLEQIRISDLDDEEKFDENDGKYPYYVDFPEGKNYSMQRDKGSEFTNRLIVTLSRDTRNHYIFPNRGSRITADVEYITKALGSYADYMKFHLGAEGFLPVYEDIFLRLAANGYSAEHFSGDDIKIFDRYFAGGFGTIRGFKRHDVSPVNRNENSIGGQTMLVGTAELIKPVKDFMFVKVFCDAGNVWWDSFDADLGEINSSIGVGIQLKKLPLRLDYGYPVKTEGEHLDGRSGRFHFSIDYSF